MTGYDVIVIGGGPGGYVCAIRCAQLGMRVACVEGRGTLGGTCLNIGCIPSKALLHASHQLHEAQHNFGKMGLDGAAPVVNWPQMLAYKDNTIAQNTKGIEFLFKKNKVDWIKGWATIPAPGKVKVEDSVYEAGYIVIATGSEPASLPGVDIDESTVVTSTGALSLTNPPRRLVVIGAGVIGLELGSVYARLGSKVTVIEYLDTITPGMDAEIAANLQRLLKRQGLAFVLGAKVSAVERVLGGVEVQYTLRMDGSKGLLDADTVLVATGRRPFARGLALAELGIQMTGGGQIETDARWMTTVPGIYAIGDVVRGPMLAHKAEDEGMAVAQIIAGKAWHINHRLIPGVIYTWPEVASVGETEETLKDVGRAYKVGRFSFVGNGRAKAVFAGDGFVKILADTQTDRILGAHIIGPGAGDLVHEICVGMEFGATAADIARTCHAHPTFSEAVREAALACGDGPIHA